MLVSRFSMKIFPFPTKSLQLSKYPLADSTKKVFPNCCIKRNVEFCHLRTHITKKFLRMLLPRFYRKIFLFPTISLKQSKYPHTDSTKRVFQNRSIIERFTSVTWVHTPQRSFREFFCLVFMGRYFFFHGRHQSAPNVQIQIQQKECFKAALW